MSTADAAKIFAEFVPGYAQMKQATGMAVPTVRNMPPFEDKLLEPRAQPAVVKQLFLRAREFIDHHPSDDPRRHRDGLRKPSATMAALALRSQRRRRRLLKQRRLVDRQGAGGPGSGSWSEEEDSRPQRRLWLRKSSTLEMSCPATSAFHADCCKGERQTKAADGKEASMAVAKRRQTETRKMFSVLERQEHTRLKRRQVLDTLVLNSNLAPNTRLEQRQVI
jgi:hypothetical protein